MTRLFAFLALGASMAAATAAEPFLLTGDNTKITFVGAKADGKHSGGFHKLTGLAKVVPGEPVTLHIELTIDSDSLYSDDPKLTAHLKNPDFFSVKEFPKILFKLNKVEKSGDDYTQTGELTLLGKTKLVTLPSKITATEKELTITSDFSIKRSEWGMTYGLGKVDDVVKLKVETKAKR